MARSPLRKQVAAVDQRALQSVLSLQPAVMNAKKHGKKAITDSVHNDLEVLRARTHTPATQRLINNVRTPDVAKMLMVHVDGTQGVSALLKKASAKAGNAAAPNRGLAVREPQSASSSKATSRKRTASLLDEDEGAEVPRHHKSSRFTEEPAEMEDSAFGDISVDYQDDMQAPDDARSPENMARPDHNHPAAFESSMGASSWARPSQQGLQDISSNAAPTLDKTARHSQSTTKSRKSQQGGKNKAVPPSRRPQSEKTVAEAAKKRKQDTEAQRRFRQRAKEESDFSKARIELSNQKIQFVLQFAENCPSMSGKTYRKLIMDSFAPWRKEMEGEDFVLPSQTRKKHGTIQTTTRKPVQRQDVSRQSQLSNGSGCRAIPKVNTDDDSMEESSDDEDELVEIEEDEDDEEHSSEEESGASSDAASDEE